MTAYIVVGTVFGLLIALAVFFYNAGRREGYKQGYYAAWSRRDDR